MRLLDPQLEAFMAVVKHKTVHGAASAGAYHSNWDYTAN